MTRFTMPDKRRNYPMAGVIILWCRRIGVGLPTRTNRIIAS